MTNSSLIVAPESAGWGVTPLEPREIEATADGHKTRTKPITYRGLRSAAGSSASRGVSFRQVVEGGDGTIETGVFSNGLSPLFTTMCDSVTTGVHSGGTLAYDHVFTWGPTGPPSGKSITTYLKREKVAGTFDWYKYTGGRGVSLELGVGIDEVLSAKFAYDYKTAAHIAAPSISPTIPDPLTLFNWTDATVTIGGDASCLESFNLTLPTGVDVENKCIKAGDTRHEPMRKMVPELTGSANWKYADSTFFDAFITGEELALTAVFEDTSVNIEGSTHPKLTIAIGAIRFTGEDPEVSVDEATMQALPFEIVDNGTDDVVKITLVTSDTYNWLA